MSDVDERSLRQDGESDKGLQEMVQADAFKLNSRPWYVV